MKAARLFAVFAAAVLQAVVAAAASRRKKLGPSTDYGIDMLWSLGASGRHASLAQGVSPASYRNDQAMMIFV
jgi:hypothetical protein